MGWAKKMMDYFWLYHLYDKLKYSIFAKEIKLFRSEKKYAIRVHISLHVKLLLLTTMKLKTKLNAIILGFTMILSMQTAFAGSYNIVVFLTICISYANNCFTL